MIKLLRKFFHNLFAEDSAGGQLPEKPEENKPARLNIGSATLGRAAYPGTPEATACAEARKILFTVATPPPGVVPKAVKFAMDQSFGELYTWASMGAIYAEGLQFMGYPYLAELTQRPEYRRPSEIIAKEMTRKWIKLRATGEVDKTEKIKILEAELKRLGAQSVFRKAIEQDGYFGRSQVYIDMGVKLDDREELMTPLTLNKTKIGRGQEIKRLTVIEPMWTYPNFYNAEDPLNPAFFRPQTWFVMGKEIHASRLLSFVSRPVPDLLKPVYSFGGLSLSQMAKPYVDNWLRTRQSVSDLIHSFSVFVLKTNMTSVLQDPLDSGEGLFARATLFTQMRDNRNLMMLDKDTEDFSNVSASLGSLDKLQAQSQEHMAAVTGIPLVVLLGITPSGLNASSDGEIQTFYAWIEAQQEATFTPQLITLLNVIQLTKFGEIDPEITFSYIKLFTQSEKEVADTRKVEADTDAVLIDKGIIDPEESRARVAKQDDSPYSGLDLNKVIEPPGGDPGQGDLFGGGEGDPDAPQGGGGGGGGMFDDDTEEGKASAKQNAIGELSSAPVASTTVKKETPAKQSPKLAGDEEEGHAFHGNQYTGGLGAKPTSAAAKNVKAAVHELLSSGHSFTFEELKTATNATDTTLKHVLSYLKNPKYLGKLTTLDVVKDPGSGHYFVKTLTQAAPPPVQKPITTPIPEPTLGASPQSSQPIANPGTVHPSAEKKTPEQLNKDYQNVMECLGSNLYNAAQYAHSDAELGEDFKKGELLAFKNGRAKAMAQWAADKHQQETKIAPQQLYKADLMLWDNLSKGDSFPVAFAQWKADTAAEKAGALKDPEAEKKKAAETKAKAAEEQKQFEKLTGKGALPSLQNKNLIPKDYEHVTGKMFASGAYEEGCHKTAKAFKTNMSGSEAKAHVEKSLTARLANSEAFTKADKMCMAVNGVSLARFLVSTWASSSGDTNSVSVAMQVVIRDAFGMAKDSVEHSALKSLNKSGGGEAHTFADAASILGFKGDMGTFKTALSDFVKAQYDNTQEFLKEKGIKDVYVARGMGVKGGSASLVEVKLQPASSFSTAYSTAQNFGHGGSVFLTKVPASSVLGSFNTGYGCMKESEVVVLASPGMRAVQLKQGIASGISSAVSHINNQIKEW